MCLGVLYAGGYDSDVEREKIMDYSTKIYSAPIRDAAAAMSAQDNLKPHLQVAEAGAASSQRAKVSRSGVAVTKVITTAEETKVKVSRDGMLYFALLFYP